MSNCHFKHNYRYCYLDLKLNKRNVVVPLMPKNIRCPYKLT